MIARLRQYVIEIVTCLRMGARWSDRLRLAAGTMEFHAANAAGRLYPGEAGAMARYCIRINDATTEITLRRRSGDFFILHEIFTCGIYRIPPQLSRGIETIVDLGANVGLSTLFFVHFFPHARFVCVEANPANAVILRLNLAWLGARAQIVEVAITDHSGQVSFDDSGPSYDGHIDVSGGSPRMVRCCTLDEIVAACSIDHIDLLKVDIEGAERAVFRQPAACLRKAGTIIIELHNYTLDEFTGDAARSGLRVIPPAAQHGNAMVMAVAA